MRQQHQRAHFVPAGAIRVLDRQSSACAYVYTSRSGRPGAIVFQGKAQKPAWHYTFTSELAREQRVGAFFAGVRAVEQRRRDRSTERKAWANPYKPGDIFSTCWGYDQTNREYYQCVEVRGKHLIVREIGAGYVETQWLAGISTPLPGKFIGEPVRVLAQPGGFREPKHRHHFASYDEPKVIGGVPTYGAQHVSSYA